MKTDTLRVASAIDPNKLSSEFCFQSLLEQAFGARLLEIADIESIQSSCIQLLADKVQRFNGYDSTSIRVEKAQSIMASNLFTVGLYLKTFTNPDDAAKALLAEDIPTLYEKGFSRLRKMVGAAKLLYGQLLHVWVDIPNVFYRETVHGGIAGFFKLYQPEFEAQEIHITADYPICNVVRGLAGIEFIQANIEAIYWENSFLRRFERQVVLRVLAESVADYSEVLMNIYEPVLTAALLCVLAGRKPQGLCLSAAERRLADEKLAGLSVDGVLYKLEAAARLLVEQLGLDAGTAEYVGGSLKGVACLLEGRC